MNKGVPKTRLEKISNVYRSLVPKWKDSGGKKATVAEYMMSRSCVIKRKLNPKRFQKCIKIEAKHEPISGSDNLGCFGGSRKLDNLGNNKINQKFKTYPKTNSKKRDAGILGRGN